MPNAGKDGERPDLTPGGGSAICDQRLGTPLAMATTAIPP